MRGRLLLAGVRVNSLGARDIVDAAEAILLEPALNSGLIDLETAITKLRQAYEDAIPDRGSWGTSEQAQQAQRAAESLFGPTRPKE